MLVKFTTALVLVAINTTKLFALNLELEAETQLENANKKLCINPTTITVQGGSAGASFAHRMHVIHSEIVKGVGISQGSGYFPYELRDQYPKDEEPEVLAKAIIKSIHDASGEIDDVSNLKNSAAYIVSGLQDTTVPPNQQKALKIAYDDLTGNPDLVHLESLNIGHGANRHSEQGKLLYWLLDKLGFETFSETPVENFLAHGKVYKFNQKRIVNSIPGLSFADTMLEELGEAYVPNDCIGAQPQQCHVHFYFHGAKGSGRPNLQLAQTNQESPGYRTLINNMAAANRVIVVYPQDKWKWNNSNFLADEDYMVSDGIYPRVFVGFVDRLKELSPCLQE